MSKPVVLMTVDEVSFLATGAAESKSSAPAPSPAPSPSPTAAPSAAAEKKFAIIHIAKNTAEFAEIEDRFKAALSNQISCYTKDRITKGMRPITFRVTDAWLVQNPELSSKFAAALERMKKAGRDDAELRVRRGFHGSGDKNIDLIARNGLLRIGHPQNPSKSTDPGYFGDPKKGVYLACNPDYCLKYSNGLEPLSPGEEVRIIMFDVCPGKTCHVKELKLGMPQTAGFDSHSSANWLEWFLFNEDQCLPTHILMVRAFENRRVDTDDETADLEGLPTVAAPASPAGQPVPPAAPAATAPLPPAPALTPKPAISAPAAEVKAVADISAPSVSGVPTAKQLFSFGSQGEGEGQFEKGCYALGISPNGKEIWVATRHRVQAFTAEGKYLRTVAAEITKFDEDVYYGIAFDSNGEVYVGGYWNHRIWVFRHDGTLLRRFGSRGSGNAQFRRPRGLAVDGKGLLFVADEDNNRVQVLRRNGSFVAAIGSAGKGDGQLDGPTSVAVSPAGEVFVTDDKNHRIQVFDVNGKFLRKFGSRGSAPGQFQDPCFIAFHQGRLLIADFANNRVQVLLPDGSHIFSIEVAAANPYSVCVDSQGRIVVGTGSQVHVFSLT